MVTNADNHEWLSMSHDIVRVILTPTPCLLAICGDQAMLSEHWEGHINRYGVSVQAMKVYNDTTQDGAARYLWSQISLLTIGLDQK